MRRWLRSHSLTLPCLALQTSSLWLCDDRPQLSTRPGRQAQQASEKFSNLCAPAPLNRTQTHNCGNEAGGATGLGSLGTRSTRCTLSRSQTYIGLGTRQGAMAALRRFTVFGWRVHQLPLGCVQVREILQMALCCMHAWLDQHGYMKRASINLFRQKCP